MITVSKNSPQPLYRQVYSAMIEEILEGAWRPGEKIPSVRDSMRRLNVSRNTVTNAYLQLAAEGYIESRRGVGYFVTDASFDMLRASRAKKHDGRACVATRGSAAEERCKYDFSYGNMSPSLLPLASWRRLVDEVLLSNDARSLAEYGNVQGVLRLREELADYLNRSRSVKCDPSQIVITSGIQQTLHLILLLLGCREDAVAMENPGFPAARYVFEDAPVSLRLLSCDKGAAAYLESLYAAQPRMLYATPSHQMPLGFHQSLDTRLSLLSYAQDNDAFIIEDDYDSIFRFDASPLPALHSLDADGRVIYAGTFSKILSPALRLGYFVLPTRLASQVEKLSRYRCSASWLEQETLALFMERGEWTRYIRKVEREMRIRHALLTKAVKRTMPQSVEMLGGEAGLHLLLNVRTGKPQEQLVGLARDFGVRVGLTRAYWSNAEESFANLVMLGYSAIEKQDIEPGIQRLRDAWFGGSC